MSKLVTVTIPSEPVKLTANLPNGSRIVNIEKYNDSWWITWTEKAKKDVWYLHTCSSDNFESQDDVQEITITKQDIVNLVKTLGIVI